MYVIYNTSVSIFMTSLHGFMDYRDSLGVSTAMPMTIPSVVLMQLAWIVVSCKETSQTVKKFHGEVLIYR